MMAQSTYALSHGGLCAASRRKGWRPVLSYNMTVIIYPM